MKFFLIDLWCYIEQRKKYWLLPILLMMLITGGLLLAAKGSVVAPFIYTLF